MYYTCDWVFYGFAATLDALHNDRTSLPGCGDLPGYLYHPFRRNFHLPAGEVHPCLFSADNCGTLRGGKRPTTKYIFFNQPKNVYRSKYMHLDCRGAVSQQDRYDYYMKLSSMYAFIRNNKNFTVWINYLKFGNPGAVPVRHVMPFDEEFAFLVFQVLDKHVDTRQLKTILSCEYIMYMISLAWSGNEFIKYYRAFTFNTCTILHPKTNLVVNQKMHDLINIFSIWVFAYAYDLINIISILVYK